MLTRRTVLVAGAGAVAVGAVAGTVGLRLRPGALPLELAALAPLVGARFVVDGTHTVVLAALGGAGGARPQPEAFTLAFDGETDLSELAGIRTFTHPDGDLVLAVNPVGAEHTRLEAVIDRSRDQSRS